VAGTPDESSDFSYSYLKWDVSTLPKTLGKVTEATLVLTLIADPGYSVADAKATPLEVRPLKPDFSEKGWEYGKADKLFPPAGAKSLFGSGYPKELKHDGKEIQLAIDLMKGPGNFAQYLKDARGALGLALTSAMDPSASDRTSVYKLYSKDAEKKEFRPVLHIVVEPSLAIDD
jgi:hypothetical protein